ncbi:MAG: CBS domain-containing protein [Candidatus Altiarchaeales archaeon]|nr:CBS domain-containing protein [Candidatus Altiarchaeota archaeon]MBU4342161.1 CBS domain-containing protein [Candidatus Altiarchaeota archaeon]MBU4437430.1 CBS domain-containing protein [Candidatus Altiarchaeota archaeon]MCG2782831.1 CBS domain-containing protein [Candidatus Altiarchaeales archaeon]
MYVHEVMTRGVITIERDASAAEAMKKMMDRRVTSLLVERGGTLDDYGIITRKDLIDKVVAAGGNPHEVKVREIMSEPLLNINSNIRVENVARLMAKTGIRRFPVLDNGQVVGLVSNSDIIKAYALELMEAEGKQN